jgi:flagellar basal-body rod protein FlgB
MMFTTGWRRSLAKEGTKMADDPLFGVHGNALALRSQRMAMLASNIANAATPNYKAKDFDFQKALAAASASSDTGNSTTNLDSAVDGASGYRVPLQASLDGNTVELSTEQTLFAENAVQYRATLSFLQGRIGTVMTALKGE